MEHIEYLLPWSASGTERRLSLFRFGSGPRKAYIKRPCMPMSCRGCAWRSSSSAACGCWKNKVG